MNHASVAPLPRPVRDRMVEVIDAIMCNGPRVWGDLDCLHTAARTNAAHLINAQPHQIAFLRNTSEALSTVANGLGWRAGDNIVTTTAEFPANLYPWQRIASAYGCELRAAPERNGLVDIWELLNLIDGRTRIVTVSWVQFASGQKLDLRRIGEFCRNRKVLFVVDGVQGLGALELDVERDRVDAFAAGAQKYLLGPKGIALLYLSERALAEIRPSMIGWTAVKHSEDYRRHELDFRDGAVRFEGGSLNTVGICGFGEAIKLFLEAGAARIEKHLLSLASHMKTRLAERGYRIASPRCEEESSAIVVCGHDRFTAEELCANLEARNIVTSARLGRLRIAPHFYNTCAEVDALIQALPA